MSNVLPPAHNCIRPLKETRLPLPSLANELRQLLIEYGELAAQVHGLMILDRFRCGDDFCATFYTHSKPDGAYGPGHQNVLLAPHEGTIIVDMVDGEIECVEVLDRPDVREKLIPVLPADTAAQMR